MAEKVFDFKKEYKDLYLPKTQPMIIDLPSMKFIMVDGSGDPNHNPHFESAVELLYSLSYAIRMSHKKGKQPEGFFEYVVPPLEGLWWIDGGEFSFVNRENWLWTVLIRQPDFVTDEVFQWACEQTAKKKPNKDTKLARLESFEEGLCAQILHKGPYETEPESIEKLNAFIIQQGYRDYLVENGRHHEIYLSDPRKSKSESMKTVLRHPIKKA